MPLSTALYKTLIFFPTYNEVGNIYKLLSGIWAACPIADVLVIDDNSTDGTGLLLKELALELENYYGIKINPSLFFTYQTISALSKYLLT